MTRQAWIESSDALSMFPTLVWKLRLTARARESVDAGIRPALEAIRPSPGLMTPAAGWQSVQTLHELGSFAELASYVRHAAATVLRFLRTESEDLEITACWANINPPGAAHRIHSHPNNYLSGVYYLQVQHGADTINFHDPRVQTGIIRPPVSELTAENADQVVVRVQNGTLLLFPAYLEHSVDPNASEKERISISFNLMFSAFTETISKPLW